MLNSKVKAPLTLPRHAVEGDNSRKPGLQSATEHHQATKLFSIHFLTNSWMVSKFLALKMLQELPGKQLGWDWHPWGTSTQMAWAGAPEPSLLQTSISWMPRPRPALISKTIDARAFALRVAQNGYLHNMCFILPKTESRRNFSCQMFAFLINYSECHCGACFIWRRLEVDARALYE